MSTLPVSTLKFANTTSSRYFRNGNGKSRESSESDLRFAFFDHYSGNVRARIEYERRLIESGETVAHGAFIVVSTGNYYVDLLSKTFTVLPGKNEIGFDLRSMFPGLEVIEIVREEPDPHLFLIPSDLKEVRSDATIC